MPKVKDIAIETPSQETKKEKQTIEEKRQDILRNLDDFRLSKDEFYIVSRGLQEFHAVFYKLWEMGAPQFTRSKRLPTACVTFTKEGEQAGFMFNTDFWHKITPYERSFIICHEMLHIILNHGKRGGKSKQHQIANVAMDVVINHLLLNKFGFKRYKMKNLQNLCFVDTTFKEMVAAGKELPPDDKSFEYYYALIKDQIKDGTIKPKIVRGQGGGGSETDQWDLPDTVDDHDFLDQESNEDIIDKLNERLSDSEKADILKDVVSEHYDNPDKEPGKGTGKWTFVDFDPNQKKKRKWETVIKRWALKFIKQDIKEEEQWTRKHRRLTFFDQGNIYTPSELDVEAMSEDDKQIIEVFFFLDTSGSCYNLKERFFKAAATLPEDKFKIKLFCFDTEVYETTLKSKKVYGGGGTCFHIIEDEIQKIMTTDGIEYPHAIFVLTDGAGDEVKPQIPERWHWFLSEKNAWKNYIPKESKSYYLENFE